MDINEALSFLNLTKDYDENDLKKAYRKKVRETHPDTGGDNEQFSKTTEAYELLFKLVNVTNINPTNLFKKPIKKVKRYVPSVEITMSEAYSGGIYTKIAKIPIHCHDCNGIGYVGQECPFCNVFKNKIMGGCCPYCNDTGLSTQCSSCHGTGLYELSMPVTFSLKYGIRSDTIISLKNPVHGVRVVKVHYVLDDNFIIEDNELVYIHKVDLDDVIKGYNIFILNKNIKIPPFTFDSKITDLCIIRPDIYVSDKEKYLSFINKNNE